MEAVRVCHTVLMPAPVYITACRAFFRASASSAHFSSNTSVASSIYIWI